MFKKILVALSILISALQGNAQVGPDITSWIQNTTATGYGGILTNVQLVQYDATDVYVSATCIPGYDIGPWLGDPNIPANQNFVFKITRNPAPNTGTLTAIGLGHTGVWTNGVSIFNSEDGHSYNNLNIWHQNAFVYEGVSFDSCLGHPDQDGEYHHHVSPRCLYNVDDSTHHSPIIGYAFDGYPVYGAYGYSDTATAGGAIKRMRSSYQLRTNMVHRDTLADGTVLTSANYGPDVNSTYPIGNYLEDYSYVAASGDLDAHNGRWCHTPEYPSGTYAYFVTIDAGLNPVYPYTLGLTYYGIVQSGNTGGPGSGHNTPPSGTTVYTSSSAGVQVVTNKLFSAQVFPNPAGNYINLFIQPIASNNFTVTIVDVSGKTLFTKQNIQPTILYSFNVTAIPPGIYSMIIKNSDITHTEKVVIAKQ